ncbi:MAG TPA: hypothetical protein VIL09_16260 [Microvirga sp.]|jgi:hypothetical protein
MEHKKLDQLRDVADVQPSQTHRMTRAERLQRWIEILERDPTRRLAAIPEIEYMLPVDRPLARADNSPLSLAYEDPVLREEGLTGDRLGDAMNFFELNESEAHHAFCSCLGGHMMESRAFARRLHDATIGRARIVSGAWVLGTLALGLPGLLYFG